MRLFDEHVRNELRAAKYSEARFDYYNHSARPSIELLREMLENWFARYPDHKKPDLRGRFRSDNNCHHESAFFELYLHELLGRIGLDLNVEPCVEGSSARPDFLASRGGAAPFYLEATLAGLPSEAEYAADKRAAIVYDAINSIDSPNFFIELDIEGYPSGPPPSTNRLRADLTRWLSTLDPDEVAELLQREERSAPCFPWEFGGWSIVFRARPKSPKLRGNSGVRPIGVTEPEGGWLTTQVSIRDAIESKAKKYGELALPFLIAVNVVEEHCDDIDVVNALYGDEVTVVRQWQDGTLTERRDRERNGIWLGPDGPRRLQVSGVLIAAGLNPWNMGVLTPELFLNPWASKAFDRTGWPMHYRFADLSANRFRYRTGVSAGELLQIPAPWPLPEDFGLSRALRAISNETDVS